MARLLPHESAALGVVAREVGIGAGALERWCEDAQSRPALGRALTAGARLEAVISTAAMNASGKSAWCREHGVYPAELAKWRTSCTTALADPEDARAVDQRKVVTRTFAATCRPGDSRKTAPRDTALDAPHARQACVGQRRRFEGRSGQPPTRIHFDDVDLHSFR